MKITFYQTVIWTALLVLISVGLKSFGISWEPIALAPRSASILPPSPSVPTHGDQLRQSETGDQDQAKIIEKMSVADRGQSRSAGENAIALQNQRSRRLSSQSRSVSKPSPSRQFKNTKAQDQGGLRFSNRTSHPVRVAILSQKFNQKGTPMPTHWDFAPDEGGRKGLKLSLPEGNLFLNPGDILVVFAQDGSRQYWGPYIVGKTNWPIWNKAQAEWELFIE